MSIGHPIPELRLFQNLTMEIKGQGHGWGHSSNSQCGSSILSTHIPFVPCQSGIPFQSYDFFENLTLKIKGQGHGWGHSSKSQCGSNILSIHIPFIPCQLALPFRYSIFKIWPWKSRVKVKWPWCCTIGKTPVRIILWCPITKMLIEACFLIQPLEQEGVYQKCCISLCSKVFINHFYQMKASPEC